MPASTPISARLKSIRMTTANKCQRFSRPLFLSQPAQHKMTSTANSFDNPVRKLPALRSARSQPISGRSRAARLIATWTARLIPVARLISVIFLSELIRRRKIIKNHIKDTSSINKKSCFIIQLTSSIIQNSYLFLLSLL